MMASHSGELNNSATYFSSFANVNSTNKHTVGGTIGGRQQTWQPWDYDQRLKVAEKVDKYKKRLKDPEGKQRGNVTKCIAENKSRQEFVPPIRQVYMLTCLRQSHYITPIMHGNISL